MMGLEGHAAFIAAAYGLSAIAIAALIGWIVLDHRHLKRAIADLEARGVKRRSAQETRT